LKAHESFIKAKTIITDGGASKDRIIDTNNCTVMAIAVALRLPYKKAHDYARQAGRKDNEGFWTHKIVETLIKTEGYQIQYILPKKGLTIRAMLMDYYRGRYIAVTRDHAFAVVNGTIYDMGFNKPLKRIKYIYRVGNSNTIKDYIRFNWK